MRRHHAGLGLAGLFAVGSVLGCAATRVAAPKLSAAPEPSPGPVARSQPDLPPDRAAQVCLAAAAELEKDGYEADAVRQYERARELDPLAAGVARRLAVILDRQGDHTRAAIEYKRALEEHPKDPGLLNDMGYFCYERGDWVQAETWLRKALAADSKHAKAWVNLGMALAQQGKARESLDAFGKVVSPGAAQANLGMILAQSGRHQEAKQALRQALALEPDAKLARTVLAALEKRSPPVADQTPGAPRISAN